ncbi:MAG: hypothetical protein R3Y62_01655 [Eubacteriales bacterium]
MEWKDNGIHRGRIHRRVSLAVMVIDDLTGTCIHTPDLKLVCGETRAKALGKPDGYYVFLDCPTPILTVEITAWAYHSAVVAVELATLPPLHPAIKLRLTPNRRYAIPANTTCLEGAAPPEAQIMVHCANSPKPLRLLYDYVANSAQIQLYDPTGQNHEGRTLALLSKGTTQYITLGDSTPEDGGYLLSKPLGQNLPKAGTTLLPVTAVVADKTGGFFLPLPPLAVQSYDCVIRWTAGGEAHTTSQQIPCGKVTAIHLETKK